MKKDNRGFTLIELVMIIVILGILAAIAIPKYIDMQSQAQASAEKGILGGVRAGIMTYYAEQCASGTCNWPGALDSASAAACDSANACFGNVLSQPIDDGEWTKGAGSTYTGPAGNSYTYSSSDGTFD